MHKFIAWNEIPIRITQLGRAYCNPTWHWVHQGEPHMLLNLWLVVEGRGIMRTGGREYALRSGDCFFHRQWEPNEGINDPKHLLVIPYVQFYCLDRKGRPLPPPKSNVSLPPVHRKILHLDFFDTLLQRSIDAQHAGDAVASTHWLRTAILEMIRQDELPARTDMQREQLAMVEQLANDIQRNPAEFGNVESLAARAGYSKDHFIRLFRKYKNVTPGEYIIQSRIQAAVQMLRFTTLSVTQIAERLGYGDIYAFSKQFRQRTGQSPMSYRKTTL
ncbi:MAG: AraC family transcriptional regulator [Phycisphaerae bacterium]|nr:AraC family transcriptional regulator [Phycisphaerae bacterium]